MAIVEAGALAGMLTDLLRTTASKDLAHTVFYTVHLYTAAQPDDETMLVGESTNRYVAAQARERIHGGDELAPAQLGVPETKAAVVTLKGMPESAAVTLTLSTSGDRLIVSTLGVHAEYPIRSGPFVELRKHQKPVAKTDQVTVREDVLAPVMAVAKRRREPMSCVFSGQYNAMQVQVGDAYQALVMPVQNITVRQSPLWTPDTSGDVAA